MAKWDEILTNLISDNIVPRVVNRVLLFGIARAGKSMLGEKLFPNKFERVAFHREMTTDDLIGGMSLVDGSTKWLDGAALRALRRGKTVIFDEFDQFSPECRSYLHALLDDPAAITLPTGERVKAAPGYCVIATTNGLPNELPPAIYDRFDVILRVTDLSIGLQTALGDFKDLAVNAATRGASKYSSWTRPPSVNMFIAASKLRKHGMDNEKIAATLGLNEQETADFLTMLTV